MTKIAVVTDSIASIPVEIQKEYGITMIPFHVIMDGKDYLETEIEMDQIYSRLRKKENLPTTSFPSSGEFLQVYHELSQRAEAILHICLTAAFTRAYGAAVEAKEMAREKLPQTTIEIVDSRTVTAGELLVVLEVARAAAEGKSIKQVIEVANSLIPRVNLMETRDTLFFVDKGGRIFEAKSWAETELVGNFRAITECDSSTGGITKPLARAKTKTQVMEKMVDIAKERIGDRKCHVAIVHANVLDQVERLKEMIVRQLNCDEIHVGDASAMTAIHNGEGIISLGFSANQDSI